jgi:putative aldouronate transport system substrate-binding protein
MKKLLLLMSVIGVFLLAGCGKSNEAEVGTPENPYKVIWYNIGLEQQDMDRVMKVVNEYTRKKIGVVIDMKLIDFGDYNNKINMIMSSGEPFDMCFTSDWANNFRVAAKRGFLLPLNDLIEKYGHGIVKTLGQNILDEIKIDGKIYGVPIKKEAAFQLVYRFNKNYVDKYNFDISKVKKMKDLEPFLKVIKTKEPKIIPFNVQKDCSYQFGNMTFISNNHRIPGAVLIKKGNHKIINQYYNKDFLELMHTYRDFYKKGYIPSDAATRLNVNSVSLTGSWFCDTADTAPYADISWSRGTQSSGYAITSVPAFSPPVRCIMGCMIGISVNAERPDLDMKLINLLNTDVYFRNLIQYGIEGVHYKKLPDGRIKFLPEYKNYSLTSFTLGDVTKTYLFENDPADKWEKYDEWNKSAVVPPILGFAFDVTPVKTEYSALMNITDEYGPGLYTGALDPDKYIPKMLKKMKKAGLDKVMNEMQKQLDAWWAEKHKE